MPATIYKFRDAVKPDYKFPDHLFLDTSFLLSALIPVPEKPPQNYISSQCDDFLEEIMKRAVNGEVGLFTDENVLEEFFYFILRAKIECVDFKKSPYDKHVTEYKTRDKNPVSELFKDHPELISQYCALLESYYEKIIAIPIAILEPDHLITKARESISEKMYELIKNHRILPMDALHVAIAKQAGINDFVVIDGDFHRIDGINVYTCIGHKKSCSVCNAKIS